jgi:alkylation response protein AidB-like acyl-CoA dehydrogenase
MCLTEAQAGTDLGLLRTRAVPDGEGAYRITGGKIFISSGEHDLASNIVHMVLARLPDAPAGTRGISLFLVPKFLPDAAGRPGERNGVYCDAIEHKLGLHANATCVLRFENAKGYLVGEADKGLAAMFVMMNSARLGTGAQALGLNETALQKSLAYAAERLQSRAPGQEKAVTRADPILLQPDVRRMLLTQQAWAQGARMFLYWLALQIDAEQHAELAADRERAGGLLSLLTPVAKAFVSDNAVESVNLAMQVHGGSGYIVESGIEQTLRDVRILPIYEGTNGVQAHDLLARKVLADQGGRLGQLLALARAQADAVDAVDGGAEFGRPLRELAGRIEEAVPRLASLAAADPAQIGASASDFLRIVGHLVYGYFWSRAAQAALTRLPAADPLRAEKLATTRFYFEHLFPETEMRLRRLFVPAERFTNPRALAA